MSFDEKVFGWAYNMFSGSRRTPPHLQLEWDSKIKHIELVGSFLLGTSIQIKTTDKPLCSKIDRIYFASIEKAFPIEIAESFLWLKVLFHAAALRENKFWLGDANALQENIFRSALEWGDIILSAEKYLPKLRVRISDFSKQISESSFSVSQTWNNFQLSDIVKKLPIQRQLILPSFPMRVRTISLSKSAKSMGRQTQASAALNKSAVKLLAEAEIEKVELKKDGENPLVHVFEKMLTADNYQGGARPEDGSDELEDHSNALKDIKVDKLARSSKEVHSQISTNLEIESSGDIDETESNSTFSLSYPEWFESEQSFRQDWCQLREQTAALPNHSAAVEKGSLSTSASLIAVQLKSELEFVFHRAEWQNRQRQGSDIDLDAVVRNRSEPKHFSSEAERIFIRRERLIQDFALLLLVDISASTDAWVANHRVLDEIRSVVEVLAFVFEGSPEKIGVSSFSTDSRLRCSYSWLKDFEEGWRESLPRLRALEPRGYTRIGVALRHSEKRLLEIPAHRRAILLLTDAKPTDFDRYEGKHGRNDVRKAIEELEASEIRFLSLVFSEKKERIFSSVFGEQRYEVVQTANQIGQHFVDQFVSLIRPV